MFLFIVVSVSERFNFGLALVDLVNATLFTTLLLSLLSLCFSFVLFGFSSSTLQVTGAVTRLTVYRAATHFSFLLVFANFSEGFDDNIRR